MQFGKTGPQQESEELVKQNRRLNSGEAILNVFKKFGYILQGVQRKNDEKHKFKSIGKRGVVERLFPVWPTVEGYAEP